MPIEDFGTPGTVNATADTTGQNKGNLTITFDPTQLGIHLSQFVIYHMVLENLVVGCSAKLVLNANTYGYFGPATGAGREWFGALYMKSGDQLNLFFTLATSTAKPWPALTAYVIYDSDLPGNS